MSIPKPWDTTALLGGGVLLDAEGRMLIVPGGDVVVFEPDDTGPSYPAPPAAGSNAIGSFAIGESPIGDIPASDVLQTVIDQYSNSPILTSIITSFAAAVDQTENFQSFYDNVWNVDTATGYGLDLWGRIVGVSRVLEITTMAGNWFGFAGTGAKGFYTGSKTQSGGTFYTGAGLTTTSSYTIIDDDYRLLIKAKMAANITDCSIPSLNNILRALFPNRGNAYVVDNYSAQSYFGFAGTGAKGFGQAQFYDGETLTTTMTMAYIFNFPLSPIETAIVQQFGVLPVPTGVATVVVING